MNRDLLLVQRVDGILTLSVHVNAMHQATGFRNVM